MSIPRIRIHLSASYVKPSRGGKSAKTFTMTMLNHLRNIHPEEAKVTDKKRKHNECSGTDIPGTSGSNYEPPVKHQTIIESI